MVIDNSSTPPQPADDSQSFGAVLNTLMREKEVSAQVLSKRLAIHVTLLNCWRRGARVPQPATGHLQRIAQVLKLSDEENKRLQTAYQQSRMQRALASGRGPDYDQMLERLLKPPESLPVADVPPPLPTTITNYQLPPTRSVIQGQEALAMAAIAMLHQLAKTPAKPTDKPIYLTFYSPDTTATHATSSLHTTLAQWWQQAMHEALGQGWNIIHLIPPTVRIDQLVTLVEHIRKYLSLPGTYTPYYLNHYGSLNVPSGLYSVPKMGTLHLFATQHIQEVDAALYLTDHEQVNLLRHQVEYQLDPATGLASPLVTRYFGTAEAADPIYAAILDAQQNVGQKPSGRFLFERGLSFFTRPSSFYTGADRDATRFMSHFSPRVRQERIAWYTQMQQHFAESVPQKRYREACPMSAIVQLVTTRAYGLEAEELVGDRTVIATPQQVYDHLTNVLRLLDTYPNYELALLNEEEEARFLPPEITFWEVYPDQLALLEYWFPEKRHPRLPRWLDVLMRQRIIVEAFTLYADSAWNQISRTHRDKEYVHEWLRGRLSTLKENHPGEITEKD